jgi:hypothetical protein
MFIGVLKGLVSSMKIETAPFCQSGKPAESGKRSDKATAIPQCQKNASQGAGNIAQCYDATYRPQNISRWYKNMSAAQNVPRLTSFAEAEAFKNQSQNI